MRRPRGFTCLLSLVISLREVPPEGSRRAGREGSPEGRYFQAGCHCTASQGQRQRALSKLSPHWRAPLDSARRLSQAWLSVFSSVAKESGPSPQTTVAHLWSPSLSRCLARKGGMSRASSFGSFFLGAPRRQLPVTFCHFIPLDQELSLKNPTFL